jgi:hypothetical protein
MSRSRDIAHFLSLTEIDNVDNNALVTELTPMGFDSNEVNSIVSTNNYQTYSTVDQLPLIGVISGTTAFVTDTNSLYIYRGNGWNRLALINTSPVVSFDSNYYLLDSAGDSITITLDGTDSDGTQLQNAVFTFNPTNIIDSAINVSISGDTATLTVNPSATGVYNFKIFGSKSDGIDVGTDSATIDLVLYVLSLFGTPSSTTATSLTFTGDVSSGINTNDVLALSDGTQDTVVSSVVWPTNSALIATASNDAHTSGTVRIDNQNLTSSFPAGKIISPSAFYTTFGTVTSSTYNSVTSGSAVSIGSKNYKHIIKNGNSSGIQNWNTRNGLVIDGSVSDIAIQGQQTSQQNVYDNNSGWYWSYGSAAQGYGTTSVTIPNGGFSSQSFTWDTVSGGVTNSTINSNGSAGLIEIEYTDKGAQSYWTSYISAGTIFYITGGGMSPWPGGGSMNPSLGHYCICTSITAYSFGTAIHFYNPFNIIFSRSASFSGGTIYYTNSTTTANHVYYQYQYMTSSYPTELNQFNIGNYTTYKWVPSTSYHTTVNYNSGDLFSGGNSIYAGDNTTTVNVPSNGSTFDGQPVYIKT